MLHRSASYNCVGVIFRKECDRTTYIMSAPRLWLSLISSHDLERIDRVVPKAQRVKVRFRHHPIVTTRLPIHDTVCAQGLLRTLSCSSLFERECVCVCVTEKRLCVCVCEREREREREKENNIRFTQADAIRACRTTDEFG